MSELPFLKKPKAQEVITVGTEITGQLEIIKKGFITAGEQAQLEQELFRVSEFQLKALKLFEKIMLETGKTETETATFIDNPAKELELYNRYKEDIYNLLSLQQKQKELLPYLEIQVFLNSRTEGVWGIEDVKNLPIQLFKELHEILAIEKGDRDEVVKLQSRKRSRSLKKINEAGQSTGSEFTGKFKQAI